MTRRRWNQEATRVHAEVLNKVGIAILHVETSGEVDHAFQMSIRDLERLRHVIDAALPRAPRVSDPD